MLTWTIRYPDHSKAGGAGGAGTPGPPGADGADGADGKTVLNGSGAPGGGVGVDGDFYIDTAADAIYGPKTGGAWGSPTSLIGPPGMDGADAVAGAIPSEYVEMTTPRTTTSATLVDITGATLDLTLETTAHVLVILATHSELASGGPTDMGLAVNIDGTDHDEVTVHLAATGAWGPASIIHRTTSPLAAGTYTIKGRFRRESGSGTPEVTRADLFAMSLQGAKGDTGADGADGADAVTSKETPTGTVDGANVTFTLAAALGTNDMVFVDGILDPDASAVSLTLTTSFPPIAGVRVWHFS